jgi:hypothetical protein
MGWEIGFRALSSLAGTEIQPGSTQNPSGDLLQRGDAVVKIA